MKLLLILLLAVSVFAQAPEQGIVWTPVEGRDNRTPVYRTSQAPETPKEFKTNAIYPQASSQLPSGATQTPCVYTNGATDRPECFMNGLTTMIASPLKPTWVPDPSAGHYDCLEPGYVAYSRSEPEIYRTSVTLGGNVRRTDAKGHELGYQPPEPICVKEKP